MSNYSAPGGSLQPDYMTAVAFGNIPGASALNIAGRKDSISATVLDDITQIPGTPILLDPGGIQLAVKSSDATDIAAGVGVQSVRISYLDSNCIQLFEDVVLNGTTLVNTVSLDMHRIQSMYATAVGSNTVAAGNISLVNVGDTITYEYIEAGGNQSLSCRYHVPARHTAYIFGWDASAVVQRIDFRLRATVDHDDKDIVRPGVYLFQDASVLQAEASGYNPYASPIKCPAMSSIKVSAISAGAGGDAGCSMEILLIEN